LKEQKERLQDLLKTSRDWVGLADQFRSAPACALGLIGAGPLRPAPASDGRFVFLALDQRKGGDPSWVGTLDTLRTPRQRSRSVLDSSWDCSICQPYCPPRGSRGVSVARNPPSLPMTPRR
jgi:hypothetical protein